MASMKLNEALRDIRQRLDMLSDWLKACEEQAEKEELEETVRMAEAENGVEEILAMVEQEMDSALLEQAAEYIEDAIGNIEIVLAR